MNPFIDFSWYPMVIIAQKLRVFLEKKNLFLKLAFSAVIFEFLRSLIMERSHIFF